jgi:hypothetical protein
VPNSEVSIVRWLVSPPGLLRLDEVVAALDRGDDELAIAARLRQDPAVLVRGDDAAARPRMVDDEVVAARAAIVLAAATARRRARERWHLAGTSVFLPEALEQASDPLVAAWRARRYRDREVWDLCAGIGGDALALASVASRVTAVDRDAARLELLAHNARVHDVEVTCHRADALAVRPPAGAWLHADPSRRRDGRRARRLDDHGPPVPALLAAHRDAPAFGVVVSPALAWDDPGLPDDVEVEFVQVGDDLKEAVLWTGALRDGDTTATATLLPSGETRARRGPRPPRRPVGAVGGWLLEVAPAAVRARLHDDLAAEIDARRLARTRALFTTDDRPPSSGWWTARRVVAVLPARPKPLKAWLRTADPPPVELVLHGVEGDPTAWWRQLGRPPRGPRGWRIELIRRDDDRVAVVTEAPSDEEPGP